MKLALNDWEKVLTKLKKHKQIRKIQSDLTEAFAEIVLLRKSKEKKQLLTDFLVEL